MDPLGSNLSLNSQTDLNRSELQRVNDFGKKVAENDEKDFHFLHIGGPAKSHVLKADLRKNALLVSNTSFSIKKKILAQMKENLLPCVNPSGESFQNSPISLNSYDPITNYTSPRPKFLRYNPKQRRELLQRIEAEERGNGEVEAAFFPSSPNSSSKRENDNENENEEEEELEERKPWYSCVDWCLLFIFGVLLFISYGMKSSSCPSLEEFESPAIIIQKIQGKATLRLHENFLEIFESFSQMCPIVRESLCNLHENLFVSLDDETVVKEQREHGDQNQRDSLTRKTKISDSPSVESLLVSPSQEISDSSFTVREDKFHNESLDSMEFLRTSQSRLDESTPTGDQGLEDFSFTLASDTKLSDYSFNILSEGALRTFSVFLGSLAIVVGLLSCFYKYVQRPNSNSFHVFPFLPSFEFYKKMETREKIVGKKEENLDKALDISVESKSSGLLAVPSHLDDVNFELKEVSEFGPPNVKLLGEFSLIDAEATINGFGSNSKKMELSNSQFSYYKKPRGREKLSPLADMLVSSPVESTSSRFSSKVHEDKGERSDTSATSSLRRSSRLQNRNRDRVIGP